MHACLAAILLAAGFGIGDAGVGDRSDNSADLSNAAARRGLELFDGSHYRDAIAAFSDAIVLEPTAAVYCFRAACHYELGESGRAMQDLNRCLAFEKAADHDIQAAAFWMRSNLKYVQDDRQGALNDINAALAIAPNTERFLFLRAVYSGQLFDYQTAIDDLTRAIEIAPAEVEYYSYRARCWETLGELELAISDIAKVVELRPDAASPLAWRAWAYLRTGKPQVAITDLEQAVSLDPDNWNYEVALARACVFAEKDRTPENFQRAIALIESACEQTKWQNAPVLQQLAQVVGASGDWRRAVEIQQQVVDLAVEMDKQRAGVVLWKLQQRTCMLDDLGGIDVNR
ncbi:MAG: hypothetical protein CMJ58_07015 [Planctomycetaceae bacterium]|nr:hypothetical protein [Planctomycetaceae bacterium]